MKLQPIISASETAAYNFCKACNERLGAWASAGGGEMGICPPWKLGLWIKISEKPEYSSLISINWFNSCNDSLFASITLTLHKNQVHCSDVMQWWTCSPLMSAPIACRGRLQNLRAGRSTIGLYCVTIAWQRIFKCSLEVTEEGVLPHVTVESRHSLFGR